MGLDRGVPLLHEALARCVGGGRWQAAPQVGGRPRRLDSLTAWTEARRNWLPGEMPRGLRDSFRRSGGHLIITPRAGSECVRTAFRAKDNLWIKAGVGKGAARSAPSNLIWRRRNHCLRPAMAIADYQYVVTLHRSTSPIWFGSRPLTQSFGAVVIHRPSSPVGNGSWHGKGDCAVRVAAVEQIILVSHPCAPFNRH